MSFLLAKLASRLYFDPRPFTKDGVTALFGHSTDNGFPSDHTTYGSLLAFIGFAYWKKIGAIMIPVAVAVGSARVLAHVHSWIDIIAGVTIGLVAAALAVYVASKVLHKVTKPAATELDEQ